MQIVEIPVYSISVQLESALCKKEYKEEQKAQANDILNEKRRNRKRLSLFLLALSRSSD